jgi:hypothetical protein
MKCFDNALADALAARTGGDSDWKANLMAARAAYELSKWQEACKYIEAAIEMNSSAPNLKKEHERCIARLKEQADGIYDFPALAESVGSKNINMDQADFLRNTEVRDSPHHGRGLFAARDIKAGEIIFVEKATCLPDEFNPEHNSAALFGVLLEQCCKNPSIHTKVLDMYGGAYKRSGLEGKLIDGMPVVDVFLIESIRRKNCFSGPKTSIRAANIDWAVKDGLSRGLWQYAALANHACLPNSTRSFVGDLMISIATTNIRKGAELSHIYLPPKAVYLARLAQFRSNWGFACKCVLCVGESASPVEAHEKRAKVLGEIQATISKKNPAKHVPDATIRVVERLTRQLEDLHEDEVYGTLPRLMMVWPHMWLLQAWRTRKQHAKVVKYGLAALRSFGFLTPLKEGKLWVYKDENSCITTFEVVKVLNCLKEAWIKLGEKELPAQCDEAWKLTFKTLVGFEAEFDPSLLDT